MKKSLFAVLFAAVVIYSVACGGASNNAANSGKSNSAKNSNTPANSGTTTTADAAPISTSIKDLGDKSVADLEKMKGRTVVFKTEGLKSWNESSLMASYVSRTVTCKGDFSSYKDAIKAFQDKNETVYVDFKGVVDEVEDNGSSVNLKLKDCSIQHMEK